MPSPVATILSACPTRRPSVSFRRPATVIRISTVEKSRRDSTEPVSRQSPNQRDRPRRMPKMVAAGGVAPICMHAAGPRPSSGWAAEAAGGSIADHATERPSMGVWWWRTDTRRRMRGGHRDVSIAACPPGIPVLALRRPRNRLRPGRGVGPGGQRVPSQTPRQE